MQSPQYLNNKKPKQTTIYIENKVHSRNFILLLPDHEHWHRYLAFFQHNPHTRTKYSLSVVKYVQLSNCFHLPFPHSPARKNELLGRKV